MAWMLCALGDLATLRPEPSNPYDGNAVAISSDCSVQLGYASASSFSRAFTQVVGQAPRAWVQGLQG